MVMILLAVVQIGVYFHLRAVAQTAARHGLDEVRVAEGSADAGVAAANAFLDQSGDGIESRSVTAGRSETEAHVRVVGKVVSILPGVTLTIEVDVEAPVERVTP